MNFRILNLLILVDLIYKDETIKGNVMVHNSQKYKQYIKTELRYKVKVYELVEHMNHSISDLMRNIVCYL